MENIRYIKLKNKGGFVAKITVQYKGKHTDEHGNVSYDAEWKSWHSDGYRDICAAAERTDHCQSAKSKYKSDYENRH